MTNKNKNHELKKKKKAISPGWWFISPWLLGFALFTLIPFVASFYLSFCRYDAISSPEWIGLFNYKYLLSDPLFWKSMVNTFYYASFAVILGIIFGVALALLLNLDIYGISIYRTVCFIPSIVPMVASCMLWLWILNPQIGLVNYLLSLIGIQGPVWLNSPVWSKPSLIIMSIWGVGGSMIIYLAGLKDIPMELYEAATVDGATIYHRTRHITLPLLTPVIFFNLVMGLIHAFQYFTQAYIMTSGGPEDSTLFYSLYLFERSFSYLNLGYASAMAWILFAVILTITLLVFKSHRKWVHYDN